MEKFETGPLFVGQAFSDHLVSEHSLYQKLCGGTANAEEQRLAAGWIVELVNQVVRRPAKLQKTTSSYPHYWPNPWMDRIVFVPVYRLAALFDPNPFANWQAYGDKLDAYIFKEPYGNLRSVGIRYGIEETDYLSPFMQDSQKLTELLNCYS